MRLYGIQTTVSMAEIAHCQRLLRVRLVCRGCKFRPFSHANSPRLSIVCVYTWRFWPIVSTFVFSQRQLSLSASMKLDVDVLSAKLSNETMANSHEYINYIELINSNDGTMVYHH